MAGSQRRLKRRVIDYEPLPTQKAFHLAEARFKGFSGPVGSGKSAALCHEALRLGLKNKGCTGLVGAPTYNMLRDATLHAFLETLNRNGVAHRLNRSSFTLTLTETRSRILFRSMDDPEKLRGTNLAWFGIDELSYCDENAWTRLEARLREPSARELCGFGVWTPKGFDWVYRRFVASPVDGYRVFEATAFENRHLLEQTPDFYDRLKSSYDEAFYRQEVLGEYLNLDAGQVYHAFDRKANVGRFELDERAPLLWSLDFNVNPMSSVVAQRSGDAVYVVDEIVLRSSSTAEVCEEMERRYGGHRAGVRVYGDASGEARRSVSRHSDYGIIREFFRQRPEMRVQVAPARSNPPVRERVNLTNARLKSAEGERRLFVDRRCKKLIRDLEQVSYKPDSGVVDKDSDPSLTHVSDALGYLLWRELNGLSKAGGRSRRLL